MRSAHQVLNQYLIENGIRHSDQRNNILDIFLASERHLTIAEIYDLVRKQYPNIGYATVNRAMKVICKASLAEETDFGEGVRRFEHKYGHEHHDHLVCVKCGAFVEAVDPQIEELQKKLAHENGFTILRHKMLLFGICDKCNTRNKG